MTGADRIALPVSPMPPEIQRHGIPEGENAEPGSLWLRMAGHWLPRQWDADTLAAAG